jgi:hypothetical protein
MERRRWRALDLEFLELHLGLELAHQGGQNFGKSMGWQQRRSPTIRGAEGQIIVCDGGEVPSGCQVWQEERPLLVDGGDKKLWASGSLIIFWYFINIYMNFEVYYLDIQHICIILGVNITIFNEI